MNSKRTEIAKFSKIIYINNLMTVLSSEKKVDYVSFNIFSIFNVEIWMFIILFLIIVSTLGIKKFNKNIFLLEFLNSIIDHLECLIRNCCKIILIVNALNHLLILPFSVTSTRGKRIRNFSTLTWIISTFLLTVIFGNDVLTMIIAPKIIKIDSINQLNQYGSLMTTVLDKTSYMVSHNLVIWFLKMFVSLTFLFYCFS